MCLVKLGQVLSSICHGGFAFTMYPCGLWLKAGSSPGHGPACLVACSSGRMRIDADMMLIS
jgi:hypothetical protein